MARTKQPPRNPNIDRPVATIGSDIQSTKRRLTPRPTLGKVLNKGVLCKAVWPNQLILNASRGNYTAYDCVYCDTQLLIFRFSFLHIT